MIIKEKVGLSTLYPTLGLLALHEDLYVKTILSINVSNYGSTGSIMRGISKVGEQNGFICWQAYAPDKHNGPKLERDLIIEPYNVRRINEVYSRFTGMRGFQAFLSTKVFLRIIDKIKPDIIHLHNLHNNYIHVGLLFDYIKKNHIKVVWTLHDCWAFTGRCPYFQVSGCDRWKTGCHDCIYPKGEYPSVRVDRTDSLCEMYPAEEAQIRGLEDLIVDVLTSTRSKLIIAGDERGIDSVKSRFMKLTRFHLETVLVNWKNLTKKPANTRQYLLAMLYNVSTTADAELQAQINEDMASGIWTKKSDFEELMEG